MDAPRRTVLRARQLRRTLTPPEVRLWLALRQRPSGLKFRRQHPIGPYILEYYCDAAKLAIEVDGAVHDIVAIAIADRRREAWLAERSIVVLRFKAADVLRHLDEVTDAICRTALAAPSVLFAATSPIGGGVG